MSDDWHPLKATPFIRGKWLACSNGGRNPIYFAIDAITIIEDVRTATFSEDDVTEVHTMTGSFPIEDSVDDIMETLLRGANDEV